MFVDIPNGLIVLQYISDSQSLLDLQLMADYILVLSM